MVWCSAPSCNLVAPAHGPDADLLPAWRADDRACQSCSHDAILVIISLRVLQESIPYRRNNPTKWDNMFLGVESWSLSQPYARALLGKDIRQCR